MEHPPRAADWPVWECAYGIPYKEEHIICKGRWTDKTYNDFCSDFVPKGGEEDGTAAD